MRKCSRPRGRMRAPSEWQCYIGQAAVDQQIIGQGVLGEYAPAPGVG
jgi:hypothetical protein